MSLSGINKDKNDARTEPHIVKVSVSIHIPTQVLTLQVQRVKALRAKSQLTSSAPLVVVTSSFYLNNLIVRKHCYDYNLFHIIF